MLNELEKKLKFYRLSEEEYQRAKGLLGRDLLPVEWPLFSALWSEHCSYKSSKIHLRKFSYRNDKTPLMDGENAGIVDLGFGEKIAFKMESHNHPSFIEPVQGSATGVGGILRDIFTMGARPIASADYLCFGEVDADRMSYLMNGVAQGISSYGNCVGVPTVTGQTNFNKKYNKNILVNAMSVGYFAPEQKMALSNATGLGNWVVYVGAKTGRDGVHGAAMASASFDNDSDAKKPNVQIGDPFYEKLLIESCLEVLQQNLVVAMQDMGAAGLTSSSFEMASKGQVGLTIDLKKVPLRDATMGPEDILLSESQERMLLICEPKNFDKISKVFKTWGLDTAVLGEVTKAKKIRLLWGNETLTEIDPDIIVENAPRYERPYTKWVEKNRSQGQLDKPKADIKKHINNKLKQYKLNSHQWIHSQFDQRVGLRTAADCSSSVSFVRLDSSGRGLGIAVGCRPDLMALDAKLGAYDAVYYPALQLAIKGAKTLAITDCLNFGNPQKTNIMSEFVASVEAIADAAEKLDAPVISGNVSFYNETADENIVSTPATGLVALRDDVDNVISDQFDQAFESIILVKLNWFKSWLDIQNTADYSAKASQFILNESVSVAEFIKQTADLQSYINKRNLKISAIKTVGLGGVATTCLKMSKNMGFDLSSELGIDGDVVDLFQDFGYGFLISTSSNSEQFLDQLKDFYKDFSIDIEIKKIGETQVDKIKFGFNDELNYSDFHKKYNKELS